MLLLIYGKHKNDKKFKPMDLGEGCTVNNKLYATVFREESRSEVEDLVKSLNAENPDWTFEVRSSS